MRKSMKSLKTFEVVNKTDRPLARAIKKIIIMIIKKRNYQFQEWKGVVTDCTDIMKQIGDIMNNFIAIR